MNGRYDWLGFYHDAADRRLFVPKSLPALGWTVNIGHRRGMLVAGLVVGGSLLLAIASAAAARRNAPPA